MSLQVRTSIFFSNQICDPFRTVNGVTEANENTTHSAGNGLPARAPGGTQQLLSGFTSTRASGAASAAEGLTCDHSGGSQDGTACLWASPPRLGGG